MKNANSNITNSCELVLGYIPCSNIEQAKSLSEKLLQKKLIACGNILSGIQSIYFWQGQIENSEESILLVKTTKEKWNQVEQTTQDLHEYDCPCIISLPLNSVNSEYSEWVKSQLS